MPLYNTNIVIRYTKSFHSFKQICSHMKVLYLAFHLAALSELILKDKRSLYLHQNFCCTDTTFLHFRCSNWIKKRNLLKSESSPKQSLRWVHWTPTLANVSWRGAAVDSHPPHTVSLVWSLIPGFIIIKEVTFDFYDLMKNLYKKWNVVK